METHQRLRAPAMFPWDDSRVTVPEQQSRALQLSLVLTKSNRNNHQRERDNRVQKQHALCDICYLYCVPRINVMVRVAAGKMLQLHYRKETSLCLFYTLDQGSPHTARARAGCGLRQNSPPLMEPKGPLMCS